MEATEANGDINNVVKTHEARIARLQALEASPATAQAVESSEGIIEYINSGEMEVLDLILMMETSDNLCKGLLDGI